MLSGISGNILEFKMAERTWCYDCDLLEEKCEVAAQLFNVGELRSDQKAALRAFFAGKDLYLSAPTSSGKSLIFQCIPPLLDLMNEHVIGTSRVFVISPLKALMLDQVEKLKETAIVGAAIFNGQSNDILEGIENNEYSLVYTSPENMLASDQRRSILSSDNFRARYEVVIVDEAHCMVHW